MIDAETSSTAYRKAVAGERPVVADSTCSTHNIVRQLVGRKPSVIAL
jgi:hypothetical protein